MARGGKSEGTSKGELPPTPPISDDEEKADAELSPTASNTPSLERLLPPSTTEPTEVLEADKRIPDDTIDRSELFRNRQRFI